MTPYICEMILDGCDWNCISAQKWIAVSRRC